ncbi:MAG: flagellar hook-length control protein FliK [Bdellovibrionales bacterium]|nr:flagellar hook-length control protein FliK [Bdellovibrionales bacterium]
MDLQSVSEQLTAALQNLKSPSAPIEKVAITTLFNTSTREALLQIATRTGTPGQLRPQANGSALLLLQNLELKIPNFEQKTGVKLPLEYLSVELEKSGSELFLQLLKPKPAVSPLPEGPPTLIAQLLKDIVTKVSPTLSTSSLRDTITARVELPGLEALLKPSLPSAVGPLSSSPSDDAQLPILNERTFSSPKILKALIKAFASSPAEHTGPEKHPVQILKELLTTPKLSSHVTAGREGEVRSQPKIDQIAPPQKQVEQKLVEQTQQTLVKLFTALSNGQPVLGNQIAPLINDLSQLLPQLQKFFPHIERFLTDSTSTITPQNDGVEILKKLLSLSNNDQELSLSEQRSLRTAIRSILSQLSESSENESPRSRRGSVAASGDSAEKQLSGLDSKSHEREKTKGILENFIQGQEALGRINPLMQQLGEPMFLLIPGFLQGFLQHLEVGIFPKNIPDEKNRGGSHSHGYQRVTAKFSFPSLGYVEVNLAYSTDHVLLSFSSEHEAVAEFIDEHLHLLKKPLQDLLFTRTDLVSRVTTPHRNTRPEWLVELLAVKAIA